MCGQDGRCSGGGQLKIYLAARYSRQAELNGYRADLEAVGHVVTSRWLLGFHQITDEGLSVQAKEEERTRFAMEDFSDVMDADVLIAFTEEPRSSNSRGGRHVELGVALGTGKAVVIVGPAENVFCCLPVVSRYDTWVEFRSDLDRWWDVNGNGEEAAAAITAVAM